MITSPFTFVATLNAILEAGATAAVRRHLGSTTSPSIPTRAPDVVGRRTKVLMPVHLYGQCADMMASRSDRRAATGCGSSRTRRRRTARASASGRRERGASGCFSFYATKNLTTGEGGMITTSDAAVADRLRVLRNQGMRRRYEYEMAGNNFRLTDLQAALVLPQLARYDETVADAAHERRAADRRARRTCQDSSRPPAPPVARTSGTSTPSASTDAAAVGRDELVARLTERGDRLRRLLPAAGLRLRLLPQPPAGRHRSDAGRPSGRRRRACRCPCTSTSATATSTASSTQFAQVLGA